MLTKKAMIPAPPKATDEEKKFSAAIGDHAFSALIAPGSAVAFAKAGLPSIKLTKGLSYLDYEPLAPYAGGWGTPSLSSSVDLNKKLLEWDNGKVEVTTSDFRAKVDIYLKSKPDSNQILIKIDTNLNPIFYSGDAEEGSDRLYWSPTSKRKDSIYMWDLLHIRDSAGNYTRGKYIEVDAEGNIVIEINQEFLDVADYSGEGVRIDPTTQQIVSSALNALYHQPGKWAAYNGVEYSMFADTGAGDDPVIYVTSDLTVTGVDEFGDSPFLSTDAQSTAIATFSDGDQLFFGSSGGTPDWTIKCALRTSAEVWDGSTVTIASSPAKLAPGVYGFDITVDADDNVYCIYFEGPANDPLVMEKSTDKGKTWNTMAASGIGVRRYTQRAYVLSANDNGEIELYLHDGTSALRLPRLYVYNIAGNSWADLGYFGSETTNRQEDHPWRIARDSFGFRFLTVDDGSDFKYHTDLTGSWTSKDNPIGSGQGIPFSDSNDKQWWLQHGADLVFSLDRADLDWKLDPTSRWFPGYRVVAQPEQSPITALKWGESVWAVGYDGSGEIVWMQQTAYTFPAGAGIAPPAGGSITSPTNGETGVAVLPTILTGGWTSDGTTPLSGYIQLDTVSTFDSGELQESGWFELTEDGTWGGAWVPGTTLSALKLYYVRVKARDAEETPNVSEYIAAQTFFTGEQTTGVGKILLTYNSTLGTNMGFELGNTNSWTLTVDTASGANAALTVDSDSPNQGNYNGVVTINSHGIDITDIQLRAPATTQNISADHFYLVSFDGKASAIKSLQLRVTKVGCSEENLGLLTTCVFSSVWQRYNNVFKATETTTAQIRFLMGNSGTTVEFDDVFLQEAFEVFPEYDWQEPAMRDRSNIRTKTQLYTWDFGVKTKRYSFSENYVNSNTKTHIESFWQTDVTMRLIEDSDNPGTFTRVKFINNNNPYQQYNEQQFEERFKAGLTLESIGTIT